MPNKYKIKNINYIVHDLKNKNPFYLTWMCRPFIEKQKKDYDYFIYSEDDILFNNKNFNYWLQYKKVCIQNKYNLGFLRTERKNKKIFSTDLTHQINFKISVKNKIFCK